MSRSFQIRKAACGKCLKPNPVLVHFEGWLKASSIRGGSHLTGGVADHSQVAGHSEVDMQRGLAASITSSGLRVEG